MPVAGAAYPFQRDTYINCKHRWEPSNFGIKYRTPNFYIFECTRCGRSIFATLKENT